jgi:hypothetical protein
VTESAAREQLERIERAGLDKLHNANHIHSVWRDLERDFGGDLLRAHYEAHQADDHGHEH